MTLIYEILSLIFFIKLFLTIRLQTSIELEKPMKSVPPWLFTTGESRPINIAPLYNLGSSLFLNFFKFEIFNNEDIFPNKDPLKAVFNSSVNVNLPRENNKLRNVYVESIVVSASRSGEVFIGDRKFDINSDNTFNNYIKELASLNPQPEIHIQADKEILFQNMDM